MAGLRYDDYRVTLTPRAGGGHDAVAIGPDGAPHRGVLRLPFDDTGLERAVLRVAGAAARGPIGPTRDVGGAPPTDVNAEVLGAALAGALLTGDVAAGYDAARDRAAAAGRGLRLTLSLGRAPALLSVPWELLYRPPTFLANQRHTPVVRHLEVDRLPDPPAVEGPVRILGVVADPDDTAPLDVAAEQARVDRAVAPMVASGAVELDWLVPATPRRLREALRDGTYHVLHYVGHGDVTPAGEGVLYLEAGGDEATGGHAELDAGALASLLADQTALRLVVLNSCDGARTGLTDPFAGVATALVQLGVPAVVAMQFAISDAAAILFAGELYTNVIAGRTAIDAAVSEARKAIFVEQGSVEWATPVLFLADPDAELFRFPATEVEVLAPPEAEAEAEAATAEPDEPHEAPEREGTAPAPAGRVRRLRLLAIAAAVVVAVAVVVGVLATRGGGEEGAAAGTTVAVAATSPSTSSTVPPAGLVAPAVLQGTVATLDGEDRQEFDGVAGQLAYVEAAATCNPGLTYHVEGPSGELVSGFAEQMCNDRGRFPLPSDGRYALVVTSGGSTGPYELTVRPVRADRVAPVAVGSSASGVIDEVGAQDRFSVDLRAGDLLYVDGNSVCGATPLTYDLVDAAGATAIGFPRPVCQDAGRAPIAADGTYELVVRGDGRATGAYSVLLTGIRPNGGGPLAPGGSAAGTIDQAGAVDEWTFDAPAGAQVTLTPQIGCVDGLAFDVLAPGTLASELGFGHRTCDVAGPYVVTSDGTHTLRVYGDGPATGSYSLLLDVLPPA